jgi:hypothetical protein
MGGVKRQFFWPLSPFLFPSIYIQQFIDDPLIDLKKQKKKK